MAAWRYEISLQVLKNISYFPAQPFNILYLLHILNACIHLIVSGCMRVDASFPDRNTASLCPLSMASIHSSYSAYKDGSTPLKLEDF